MKATSIRLTDHEEEFLTNLSAELRCFSRYGATSGQPSWRVMLQHIAEGRLRVSNPMDKTRQLYINFKKPPTWWAPDSEWAMDADYVAARYKASVEDLVGKGFFLLPGNRLQGDWKSWKKTIAPTTTATPPAADDKSLRQNLERSLERSDIPEPDWFVRSPIGAPLMPLEAAIKASNMEKDEIEDNGLRIINRNGQKFVTGPEGSTWGFQ
jgi:hypothetical protein